ncbi:MAG TPA: RNA polymerase sigma factor [Myxococcota bacterium]|nr:RNA polymerase sigma factor [Myxococcota bacterium]
MGIAARERAAREEERPRSPSLVQDLDRLFESNRSQVQRLCMRLTGSSERAEELVQETLVVAYTKLPEFHGAARFSTWIYGIARNLGLNAIRKRQEVLSEDGVLETEEPAADALRLLRREERQRLLRVASEASLDPGEQEAVHMRYVLELPLDRIEAVLGIGSGEARVLLQRSKRKLGRELRSQLAQLGQGPSLFHSQS